MDGLEIIIFLALMMLSVISSYKDNKRKRAREEQAAEEELQQESEQGPLADVMRDLKRLDVPMNDARQVLKEIGTQREPEVQSSTAYSLETEAVERYNRQAESAQRGGNYPTSLETEAMRQLSSQKKAPTTRTKRTSTSSAATRSQSTQKNGSKSRINAPVEPAEAAETSLMGEQLLDNFDPAKAIIYSEIMTPKYTEY